MSKPTTHLCPAPGAALTPCCGKSPAALPIGDKITLRPEAVTCGEEPGA